MYRKVLPNLTIIFSLMCFVLFVIDVIKGGAMSFLDNPYAKGMHAVLCLLSFATAFSMILSNFRAEYKKAMRRERAERSENRHDW